MKTFNRDGEELEHNYNPPAFPSKHMINGEVMTIVDAIAYKFLEQEIAVESEMGIETSADTFEKVSARIVVLVREDGAIVIRMEDPIFYPKFKYKVCEHNGYTYESYSKCVEEYKLLGYEDVFAQNSKSFKNAMQILRERKTYIRNWAKRSGYNVEEKS